MKCTACNAPVDYDQRGHLKFDSSLYRMDVAKVKTTFYAGYREGVEGWDTADEAYERYSAQDERVTRRREQE